MSTSVTGGTAAIERALVLLDALVRDRGRTSLSDHAQALDLPISTAYRMVEVLRRHGLVAPARRGHYIAGMGLAELHVHADPIAILVDAARPLLRRLAREARATAHLGIFENDMISYVVKEHGGGPRLFTREDGQLEAYCSAIGKVLLAHLPDGEREAYLASGPFVALTSHTVTDPNAIRETLAQVRSRGFAVDDREIADDLYCVAVPVEGPSGDVLAALSISTAYRDGVKAPPMDSLRRCAEAVSKRLGTRALSPASGSRPGMAGLRHSPPLTESMDADVAA